MNNEIKSFESLAKIIIFIIILPLALIWFVWNKTDWKKQNKWIATIGIGIAFLFFFVLLNDDGCSIEKENSALISQQAQQIAQLQKQIELNKTTGSGLEEEIEKPQKQNEILNVSNIVDGDTIKLNDGQLVRYIGIDAPETVDPGKSVQCFGKEATEKNKELVEGKEVVLVEDVSDKDKYDRLLRYVYAGNIFVNDYLVRNGFAKADNFPPDTKFKDQFKEAEEEARNNKRGLWADDACKTEEVAIPSETVITPIVPEKTTTIKSSYSCNCSKTCPQMDSCAEAQYQLNVCGCSRRDADHDGIACDTDCQ